MNEDYKIFAADGEWQDFFGWTVCVTNDSIFAGAVFDDESGTSSGLVHKFVIPSTAESARLLPKNSHGGERFGYSMVYHSGNIAIGAYSDNENSPYSGAAFIFDNSGTQLHKLLASDGLENDHFGWSISIENGTVAVGAPRTDAIAQDSGAVYLFDVFTGIQISKLTLQSPQFQDFFGNKVAIEGTLLAVSAPGDDSNGINNGAVHIFDITTGAQLHTIVCPDSTNSDGFGSSLSMNNGLLAIGSSSHDHFDGFQPNAGVVYLFDPLTSEFLWEIIPTDSTANQYFGHSVAVENDLVVVGAFGDDIAGTRSGSAYVFDSSTKTQTAKLLPSDPQIESQFGYSVAINNGYIAVGANQDRSNGNYAGSVYAFSGYATSCAPDLTGDGTLNFFDISAFLAAYSAQDSSADFEPDGNFNFFDVSAYLIAFGAGCP